MPRRRQDPIEFRIRAKRIPRGMKPRDYLESIYVATAGIDLPDNLKVELFWRNPETKNGRSRNWQSADFETAVSESNAGFSSALRAVIQRKIDGVRSLPMPERMKVTRKKPASKRKRIPLKRVRVKRKRMVRARPSPRTGKKRTAQSKMLRHGQSVRPLVRVDGRSQRKPRQQPRGKDGRFIKRRKR